MRFVFIDPSGSFNEGKGHTGISIIEDFQWETLSTYSIAAKDFDERHLYWKTIIDKVVKSPKKTYVVIESFVNRNNGFLIGKMPETPLFIGALVWELEQMGISYEFQSPTQAKSRFKDEHLGRYIPNYTCKELSGKTYYYLRDNFHHDQKSI